MTVPQPGPQQRSPDIGVPTVLRRLAGLPETDIDDRRRSQRTRLPSQVQVLVNGALDARVVDISPLGAQLEAASALRQGSSCHLCLPSAHGMLRLRARVRRSRATTVLGRNGHDHGHVFQAGLEFIDLSERDWLALNSTYGRTPPAHHQRPGRQPLS